MRVAVSVFHFPKRFVTSSMRAAFPLKKRKANVHAPLASRWKYNGRLRYSITWMSRYFAHSVCMLFTIHSAYSVPVKEADHVPSTSENRRARALERCTSFSGHEKLKTVLSNFKKIHAHLFLATHNNTCTVRCVTQ